MRYVQWERIAAILVSVLSGAVLGYLLLRYALPLLLPFLVAFGVSLMIRPLAKKLSSRLHLPRGLCAAVLLLSVFVITTIIGSFREPTTRLVIVCKDFWMRCA